MGVAKNLNEDSKSINNKYLKMAVMAFGIAVIAANPACDPADEIQPASKTFDRVINTPSN